MTVRESVTGLYDLTELSTMSTMQDNDYEKSSAPGEIRTPDRLVRSQVLYPAELRALLTVAILTKFVDQINDYFCLSIASPGYDRND